MIKRKPIRNRARRSYQLKTSRGELIASRKKGQIPQRRERKARMTTTSSMKKVRRRKSMKMRRSTRKNTRMSKPKKMEMISKNRSSSNLALVRRKKIRKTVSIDWWLQQET